MKRLLVVVRHAVRALYREHSLPEPSDARDTLLSVKDLVLVGAGTEEIYKSDGKALLQGFDNGDVPFPVGIDVVALVFRLDCEAPIPTVESLALVLVVMETLAEFPDCDVGTIFGFHLCPPFSIG